MKFIHLEDNFVHLMKFSYGPAAAETVFHWSGSSFESLDKQWINVEQGTGVIFIDHWFTGIQVPRPFYVPWYSHVDTLKIILKY